MGTTVVTQSVSPSLPFSQIALTQSINNLTAPFGQITAAGMFPEETSPTPYIEIESVNGILTALPMTGEGPASIARHDSVTSRVFKIPTFKHQDDIKAKDIISWYAAANRAGGERYAETLANLMNTRLGRMKLKFALTEELMRMSGLKGVVIDGAGNEVINFFTAFGITKKQVFFNFADANSDIRKICDDLIALITQDLSDETMTRVEARVSRSFFNNLISHPKVEKYWLQSENARELANLVRKEDGAYTYREFTFGSVTFIENPVVVPLWGGTTTPIIAANMGHAYPAGTLDTHRTYLGPVDDIRTLNGEDGSSDADKIHITTEPMKHGAGIEMLGRMNALPMWSRPKLLVELSGGSGTSTAPADGQ